MVSLSGGGESGLLVSGGLEGAVRVWDLRRGVESVEARGCLTQFSVPAEEGGVASLQAHTGQTGLLLGTEGSCLYDLNLAAVAPFSRPSWRLRPPSPSSSASLVRHVYRGGGLNRYNLKRSQRSEDGRYFLRGNDEGQVCVWEAGKEEVFVRWGGRRGGEED